MAEYIERESLVENLRKSHEYHARNSREEVLLYRDIRIVSEQPVADVAPVVHGHWIRYHEADIGWDEYGYRCSNCKIELEDKDFWDMFTKRCPNCGARMDGDGNG